MSKRLVFSVCFAVFFLQSCEIRSKQGIIISRLKGASKLSTVEVSMTKFVYSSEELRNLWDKIVGKDKIFLSKTQATLKLGVDLSRIQEKDIKIRGTRVELELPPVQVMNFSYPAEKFEVDKDISDFDLEKISRKNAYKLDKIYQSAELQIWEQIDEIGMHKTVEEKTEKLIRHILENLGFTEVYITFKARQPFKFNIGDPMIDSLML